MHFAVKHCVGDQQTRIRSKHYITSPMHCDMKVIGRMTDNKMVENVLLFDKEICITRFTSTNTRLKITGTRHLTLAPSSADMANDTFQD